MDNKKRGILKSIVSNVRDFVNPLSTPGSKKAAEFSSQVMKYDSLKKKLESKELEPKKKFYSKKMIENEADKIFTKNRPDLKLKDGTFPRAYGPNASAKYNREYDRTYNQVKKTRESMSK